MNVDQIVTVDLQPTRLLVLTAAAGRPGEYVDDLARQLHDLTGIPIVVLSSGESLKALTDEDLAALGLRKVEP